MKTNKKLLLLILLTSLVVHGCFPLLTKNLCKEDERISSLIKKLDNNSFVISSNSAPEIILKDEVFDSLSLKDKNTSCIIISSMKNIDRTIPLHLLLTKVYEGEKFDLSTDYIYEKDLVVGTKYTVNGLTWEWIVDKDYYLDVNTQQKVITNWKEKMKLYH